MNRTVTIELPWPPSVNTYWRRAGIRIHISNKGREYREQVGWLARQHEGFGRRRVEVEITAFPPDSRRRDLDNLSKGLLDALQHGQLFDDDSQIDRLSICRGPQRRPAGAILVKVREA